MNNVSYGTSPSKTAHREASFVDSVRGEPRARISWLSCSAPTWQPCHGHSTYSLPYLSLATTCPGDILIPCLHDSNILTPLLLTCIQFSTHRHSELLQMQVRSHLSQWFSIAWNKCKFLTLANMAHVTQPLLPASLISLLIAYSAQPAGSNLLSVLWALSSPSWLGAL